MLNAIVGFFKSIGGAVVKAWAGADTLGKINMVFMAVTTAVGVKGFLQARQMLSKGQDIMANKSAAGGKIPVIYGTRRVGCQVVYMDTAQNRSKDLFVVYALAVGECEEILGKTIEIDGNSILDGNIYKGGGYVGSDKISSGNGSLNTASQVGDNQYSNAGTLGTDPTLRYSFVFNLHHGASSQTADPMLRASIPTEWTTNHKLNGICYIAASFDYDKKGMYKGVPQITVQVKGKKVFDPRDNSTKWSSNPALCFLDYIQNDEYGKGLTTSQINMTTISAAATACEVEVDQPYYNDTYQDLTWSGTAGNDFIVINDNDDWWQNKVDEVIDIRDSNDTSIFSNAVTITGSTRYQYYDSVQENRLYIDDVLANSYTNEAGNARAKVKRFHCNGYIDTNKNVMDNAKELLANMRGIFLYIDGKYELQIEDTGTSTFSITDNHIIADAGISVDYGNKDKKANKVVIEFFNANKKYELDTATVLHDASPEYYSDDGEVLEVKAEFPYVTDPYIAYNMGKAILTRSRNQTTMQFLGTPEMYKLNVGDIVDLTYSGLGFSGKVCRVEALELQANGLVSVSLIEYFDVYTWEVPTQESTEIIAKIPTIGAIHPPEANSIVFTDTDASSINRPTLTWTEPTDFPVRQYRVDVVDSSDNNVFSKIVDTPSVDLAFLSKGSNYEASITAFNGVGIESNASTKTFTIADDPVKTTEVEMNGVTLSTVETYGTVSGKTGNWVKFLNKTNFGEVVEFDNGLIVDGGNAQFENAPTFVDGFTGQGTFEISQGSIQFGSYTPSTTTNRLYNVGGSLYWNGQALGTGTGDITAVVAGTNLNGGGTSGSVTLNLDSTITGDHTFSNNIIIQGNLTVQGTTTSVNTDDLNVKDKNITLNYSTGDSSASANGAGITIQDAVSATQDATLTWNTANDSFNFSHPLNVTGNVSSSGTVSGQGVSVNSSGYGSIEVGGVSGAFIDLKRPNTDDFDLRLITTGTGGQINAPTGATIALQINSSNILSVSNTGIDVTGNITSTASTGSGTFNLVDTQNVLNAGNKIAFFAANRSNANEEMAFIQPRLQSNSGGAGNVQEGYLDLGTTGNKRISIQPNGDISFYDDTGTSQNLKWDASADTLNFVDNAKATFGASNDLQINHNGTNSSITNSTGSLNIQNNANDADINLISDDGSGGTTTYFKLDGSLGYSRALQNIRFDDNVKATFGSSNDLEIYHDGSHSYIKDVGTGNLWIGGVNVHLGNPTASEYYIQTTSNGAVTLYYDNSAKLATTTQGINVTNLIQAEKIQLNASGSDNPQIQLNNNDFATFDWLVNQGDNGKFIVTVSGTSGAEMELSSDGSDYTNAILSVGGQKVLTQTAGINLTGNLGFNDNVKATFGTGNDLQIYHDGSNSYINDLGDGFLKIGGASQVEITNNTNTEQMAVFKKNGAVELYYDNAEKLATTSTGIDVTGTVTSDGVVNNQITEFFSSQSGLVSSGSTAKIYATNTSFDGVNGSLVLQSRPTAGADVYIATGATAKKVAKFSDGGDISFYEDTGTTQALFWDASAESLGIGTTSPDGKLEIGTSTAWGTAVNEAITISNTGSGGDVNNEHSLGRIRWNTNSFIGASIDAIRDVPSAGNNIDIAFSTNTGGTNTTLAERMRINYDGNVGIGTSLPSELLEVSQATDGATIRISSTQNDSSHSQTTPFGSIEFYSSDASGGGAGVRGAIKCFPTASSGAAADLAFTLSDGTTNDIEVARFTQEGRLGIGTTSPMNTLSIKGSVNQLDIETTTSGVTMESIDRSDLNAQSDLSFYARHGEFKFFGSSYSERARIDTSGNLLVGTTNTFPPSDTGNEGVAVKPDNIAISRNASTPLFLDRMTSDGTIIDFRKDNSTVGSIGTVGADVTIGTGDTGLRFRDEFDAIQPHNITTNGTVDGVISLGKIGARFKDLYLSGTISSGAIDASGNVTTTGHYIADTHFRSSDSNATLSATGGGGVYLRPDGNSNSANQVYIESGTGNATFAGTISSSAGAGWLDFNMDTDNIYPTGTTDNITVLGSITHHVFVGDSNANGTGGKFYWGYGVNSSDSGTFTETMELDRSGNLTVAGTINSGAITANSSGTNTVTIDGTGTKILRSYHDSGGVGWATGSGTSYTNLLYLDDNNDRVRIYTEQAERLRINATGIDARTGGFRINATTVIDSSRNLTNIGTISSGAIDVTGTVVSDGATIAGTLELDSNNLDHTAATPQYTMIESDVTGNNTQFLQTAGDLRIRTVDDSKANPVERLRIDHATGDISFYEDTGTTAKLFWDASAESLGIGTTPSEALHVYHATANINAIIESGDANAYLAFKDNSTSSSASVFLGASANDMTFFAGGTTERMRIDSSGKVGIGTTPSEKLHVLTTGNTVAKYETSLTSDLAIELKNSQGSMFFGLGGGEEFAVGTTSDLNGSGNLFAIKQDGKVGIGETNIDAKLHLTTASAGLINQKFESAGNAAWRLGIPASQTYFAFDNANDNLSSPKVVIDASGNLLVGKTSASTATVGVEAQPIGLIKATRNGSQAITLNRLTSDGDIAVFKKDGTDVGSVGVNSSTKLYIGAGDSAVRFDPDNNAIRPHNASTNGSTDAVLDLGVSNNRFKDLYLSGEVETNTITALSTAQFDNTVLISGLLTCTEGSLIRKSKSSATNPILTVKNTSTTNEGRYLQFTSNAGTDVGQIGKVSQTESNIYLATFGTGLKFESYITYKAILPCDGDGADSDNAIDLGSSSVRFDDIYATNGTIQTSDRNQKQDIQALTDAEQRVATACKGLIRRFRWQDSVAEKDDNPDSDETARYHFGVIAQDLQDAFTAEGLDAGDYGMFISSTWTDDDGNEQTRLGVRYNELLAFIITTL